MADIRELIRKVECLNNDAPYGVIRDADTILKDILDEQDFEITGIAQDIFNIYKKSTDKTSVKEMFFEFTGVDFDEYLNKCIKEITREE